MNSGRKKSTIIFCFALILILVTLFSGRDVALTNNGDYRRVIKLSSLDYNASGELKILYSPEESVLANTFNILLTPKNIVSYPSTQLIPVRLSVALSFIINTLTGIPQDTYSISSLGIMLSILYALALSFTLSKIRIKNKYLYWGIIAVILFMMCDIGYVSYFNSLYGEGFQHILFIALFGFILTAINRPLRYSEIIFSAFLLLLYGLSKFFNIPIAILIALTLVLLSLRYKPAKKELVVTITALLTSSICLISAITLLPNWISKQTNYNSVFHGILKDCTDEEAKDYLDDLGLDPDLYVLKNTHSYVSDFDEIGQKYDISPAKEISQLKLMMFYASHPRLTLSKMKDIAMHSGMLRNIFFLDADYMNDAFRLTLWSKIRENTDMNTIYLNFSVIIVFLALIYVKMSKHKLPLYIKILIPLIAVMAFGYSFIVPYVSNGEADLAKHMYLFAELIDIAIISVILLSLNSARRVKTASLILFAVFFAIGLIPHKTAQIAKMGGYEWFVIDENNTYKTLFATEPVAYLKYHGSNDNNYRTSDIHKWLNESFINNFSEEERAQLYTKDEQMLLSVGYKSDAVSGNRDFYCAPYPENTASNYETAYKEIIPARIFLPTTKHITMMAKKGYKTSLNTNYWLSTPYFNNSEKARYVHTDGLVYFEYTTEEMAIRPIIYVKK